MAPRFAPIAPVELLFAHAMPAAPGEPHARPGAHLRVSSPPRLGLPVMPFLVRRAVVSLQSIQVRSGQVVFVDSADTILTPPFTLTADNPVTAYLVRAPGDRAIWAEVIVDAAANRPVSAVAWGTNVHGLEFYGARAAPRLAFTGPNIVQIDITGDAMVTDVRWFTERDTARAKYQEWDALNLPHQGGPRYLSVPHAVDRAMQRVDLQAPKRAPLQEAGGTPSPDSAPGWSQSAEHDRVASLTTTVPGDLTSLIMDTGQPQAEQTATEMLSGVGGSTTPSLSVRRLMRVLAGTIDPGTATYLGFKAYDPVDSDVTDALILYRVDGVFRTPEVPGPDELAHEEVAAFHSLISGLGPASTLADAREVIALLADSGYSPVDQGFGTDPSASGLGYRWLGALAVADLRAPLLPPPPPEVVSATHQGWIAQEDPTRARRHVEVAIEGVLTSASLAAVRQVPPSVEALNRRNQDGFHVPLTLGHGIGTGPLDTPEPGVGHLSDHDAPGDQVGYGLAQQDRFGRWSDWQLASAPPGPRPTPPRPVYTAAFDVDSNTVRLRVNVPRPESLAPGARPLASLSYSWQVEAGAGGSESVPLTDANAPILADSFPGPSLPASGQASVTVSQLRWIDTDGTASPPAEPSTVTALDPRPPAAPSVPNQLVYAARPDALGRSVVDLEWTAAAGVAHAVYYTDENRLVAALGKAAAAGDAAAAVALADLGAAPDKAARAAVLRDNSARFGADLFERLIPGSTAEIAIDGATRRVRHWLSGSLDVLSGYRIAAEGPTGSRPSMNDLDLVLVAVPNVDPPPRPTLAATFDRAATAVALSVTCGPARTEPVRFELARTVTATSAFEQMVRVAVTDDTMSATDSGFAGHHVDAGPVAVAPSAQLRPWRRYTWIARLQGGDLPGSSIPGRWSEPSDPVSVLVVPPGPPAAATFVVASGVAGPDGLLRTVTLSFDHPEELLTIGERVHRARLTRRRPGAPPDPLGDVPIHGDGPYRVDAYDPSASDGDAVDAGTSFDLSIVDPLGEAGPSASASGISVVP